MLKYTLTFAVSGFSRATSLKPLLPHLLSCFPEKHIDTFSEIIPFNANLSRAAWHNPLSSLNSSCIAFRLGLKGCWKKVLHSIRWTSRNPTLPSDPAVWLWCWNTALSGDAWCLLSIHKQKNNTKLLASTKHVWNKCGLCYKLFSARFAYPIKTTNVGQWVNNYSTYCRLIFQCNIYSLKTIEGANFALSSWMSFTAITTHLPHSACSRWG